MGDLPVLFRLPLRVTLPAEFGGPFSHARQFGFLFLLLGVDPDAAQLRQLRRSADVGTTQRRRHVGWRRYRLQRQQRHDRCAKQHESAGGWRTGRPDNRPASGSGEWRRARCDRPRRQRALVRRGTNFPYLVNGRGRSFGSSFLFGLRLPRNGQRVTFARQRTSCAWRGKGG